MAAIALAAALAVMTACEAVDKQASLKYEAATKRWYAGDYSAAVSMYISMVKNHPYSPQADNALYWVGVTQFLYLGETEKSLQTFRILLKKYPGRDMAPPAQLYIAEIYELGYNDYVRAIEEYRKATLYSDKEVRERSLYSLADNLFRVGKIDDALSTWKNQVKLRILSKVKFWIRPSRCWWMLARCGVSPAKCLTRWCNSWPVSGMGRSRS